MPEHDQPALAIHPHLHDLLVRELRIQPDTLDPASTLEAIGLDSLAVVELSVLLAEEFEAPVTEDQIAGLRTLENLNRFFLSNSRKG
ncbi:acyl carrier protein [Streptomyces sp. NRRL WC-3742]|uniref:acyl carrier protein n=1 Tax=Streptomyces sp. NRRL WC-3742 TaxID=1463934 RepID=UPI001F44D331|nr:acyl carrier protein [Streptomyces sp. NRRL WC-3742]